MIHNFLTTGSVAGINNDCARKYITVSEAPGSDIRRLRIEFNSNPKMKNGE